MESNTSNAIYTIRNLILSGELKPNEEININRLSTLFNIAKGHFAEACAILENEGYILYSPNGPVVRTISTEEISIWLNKRFSIELDISERLAYQFDNEKLEIIQQNMEAQDDAIKNDDVVKFLELNADFHYHLACLAGFPTAAQWFKVESIRLKISEIKALNTPIKLHDCFEEHRAIVTALQSNKPHIARNAMRVHLEKTAERVNIQ